MKYFTNTIKSLEELRKEYKRLLKHYHPDNGGSTAAMQDLNCEYDILFKALKDNDSDNADKMFSKYDVSEDAAIRETLAKVINLNIEIEIIGTWIWVSGNTYPVKDQLKAAGFKWAAARKAWQFHTGAFVKHGKGKRSMQELRQYYGSQTVRRETDNDRLTA